MSITTPITMMTVPRMATGFVKPLLPMPDEPNGGGDDVPGAVIPDRAASRKVGEAAVSAEGIHAGAAEERTLHAETDAARDRADHDEAESRERGIHAVEPAVAPDEPPDHAGMDSTQLELCAGASGAAGISDSGDVSGSGSLSESSQSVVTSNALASRTSFESSGTDSPVSHLLIACRDTPSFSASASCERPAFFRQYRIFFR